MAIRHIRDAFNEEAKGYATCQEAYLHYEEGNRQVITIEGVKADGTKFKLATPPHCDHPDPHHHARLLARSLKDEEKEEPVGEVAGEPTQPTGSHAGSGGEVPAALDPGREGAGVPAWEHAIPNPFLEI